MITSRRGDQPAFLSIQFFFRSRRMRISDMALPLTGCTSHRSGGDPALAGANERQQVPDLRNLVHLGLSNIQGPSHRKFRLEKDLISLFQGLLHVLGDAPSL